MGITVFLRASTKPSGEPKRKKSDTSKSNFPREPPSSMVLLLDLREAVSFRRTLECKLERQHKVISLHRAKNKTHSDSTWQKDSARILHKESVLPQTNTPGQESLVLLYRVQLVRGGVASFARQLSLGVVTRTGTWNINVAATEVAAPLQGWRCWSVCAVDNDARREKILVLRGQFCENVS